MQHWTVLSDRKIHIKYIFSLSVLGILFTTDVKGQIAQDLYIYGYFQTQYRYSNESIGGIETKVSTFSLQQLNLLASKKIGHSFSGFIDIEALNTYSSEDGWGALKFSEAWIRYKYNRAFSIRAGLQVPAFNNLNRIKNRTPLLPYILRPAVYESAYNGLVNISEFIPDQTFLSIDGTLAQKRTKLDYTIYVGNERGFINTEITLTDSVPIGADTTLSKLIGGRVGIRHAGNRLGASFTLDKSNKSDIGLGRVQRYRLGADIGLVYKQAFFEGEFIWVRHNLSTEQETGLVEHIRVNPFHTRNLDKHFYYGMLGYHLADNMSVYAAYNWMADKSDILFREGVSVQMYGMAFKPADPVALKVQYVYIKLLESDIIRVPFDGNMFLVGASLLF